jgi:hypothetical protein
MTDDGARSVPSRVTEVETPSCCRCCVDVVPLVLAARRLDKTPATLRKWRRRGLPVIAMPGSSLYVSWRRVEAWMLQFAEPK